MTAQTIRTMTNDIFDVVLRHLQSTGELPQFGQAVEASLNVTLHSGGGYSPHALHIGWANQSMAILHINSEIAEAWDKQGGPEEAIEEFLAYREADVVEFLRLLADCLAREESRFKVMRKPISPNTPSKARST